MPESQESVKITITISPQTKQYLDDLTCVPKYNNEKPAHIARDIIEDTITTMIASGALKRRPEGKGR